MLFGFDKKVKSKRLFPPIKSEKWYIFIALKFMEILYLYAEKE